MRSKKRKHGPYCLFNPALEVCVHLNRISCCSTTWMNYCFQLKNYKLYLFYRNPLQAIYTIIRTDGLLAIQKGLVPGLCYQFFMNGFRLGSYQMAVNAGLTKDTDGRVTLPRSVVAGACAGTIGAVAGSPFYMVCKFGMYIFSFMIF